MRTGSGRIGWLGGVILLVALAAGGAGPATKAVDYYAMTPEQFAALPEVQAKLPEDPAKEFDVQLLNAAVFHATNVARTAEKLPPFKPSDKLEQAARDHSVEMGRLNYFSHDSPVPEHRTFEQRIDAVGFTDRAIGENIAVRGVLDIPSGRAVTRIVDGQAQQPRDSKSGQPIERFTYAAMAGNTVTGWMHSPPHRANILNPSFVYLGCGCARGPFSPTKQDSVYSTQDFGGAPAR